MSGNVCFGMNVPFADANEGILRMQDGRSSGVRFDHDNCHEPHAGSRFALQPLHIDLTW